MGRKRKSPKRVEEPSTRKEPKIPRDKEIDSDLLCPAWRFSAVDEEWSEFGWSKSSEEDRKRVYERLRAMEGRTWQQLKNESGCHNVLVEQLVKKAQRRLIHLRLDDRDELYSLRVSGKKRVWGYRDQNTLRILWWDPHHAICPSAKKST